MAAFYAFSFFSPLQHTFCRYCVMNAPANQHCPIHGVPLTKSNVISNLTVLEQIGELFVRCRFGVQLMSGDDTVAIPDPKGFNYDEPSAFDTALLESHLAALRAGRPADLPIYDYATHRRQQAVDRVQPKAIVLLEGILVLSEPRLRALLDLQVFVDTALDICLIRRIRRDAVTRGRGAESVIAQYLRDVRPAYFEHILPAKPHADLVLDGTEPVEGLVERLERAIEARLTN